MFLGSTFEDRASWTSVIGSMTLRVLSVCHCHKSLFPMLIRVVPKNIHVCQSGSVFQCTPYVGQWQDLWRASHSLCTTFSGFQ